MSGRLVMSQAGILSNLQTLLDAQLSVRLYTAASTVITPAAVFDASTFTELTASGYAAVTLTLADWTLTMVNSMASATADQITWTMHTGTDTVPGLFITEDTSLAPYAQVFNVASVLDEGGVIQANPRIRLRVKPA